MKVIFYRSSFMSEAKVERVASLIKLLGVRDLELEILVQGVGRSGDMQEDNIRDGVT